MYEEFVIDGYTWLEVDAGMILKGVMA